MQTLLSRADIIARDAAGGLVVVVEVKNREGLTPEIATQLHRNMVAHGLVGRVPYFLLLSQDVGYLWLEKPDSPIDAPATLRFPMQRVVERYSAGVLDRKRLREHYDAGASHVCIQPVSVDPAGGVDWQCLESLAPGA